MGCLFLALVSVTLAAALIVPWIREGLTWRIDDRLGGARDSQLRWERQMAALYEQVDALVPDRAVLIFGDSLLHGVPLHVEGWTVVDRAISGLTARRGADLMQRLGSVGRAGGVVIALGINDLVEGGTDGDLIDAYRTLLRIPPRSAVRLCVGLLPRSARHGDVQRRRSLNSQLKAACSDAGATYADAESVLAGPDGALIGRFDRGDGTHLSMTGYAAWLPVLRHSLSGALSSTPATPDRTQ